VLFWDIQCSLHVVPILSSSVTYRVLLPQLEIAKLVPLSKTRLFVSVLGFAVCLVQFALCKTAKWCEVVYH